MKLLLILILLIVLANAILIDKALAILSPKELKRRARGHHHPKAVAIYKMAAYEQTLSVLLWLKGAVSAAFLFIILAQGSWLVALIFVAIAAWAVRVWRPKSSTDGWVWSYAARVAPLVSAVMNYLQPILSRLTFLATTAPVHHRAVYEKEDLVELLNAQAQQPENRIPDVDLKLAASALNFGDQTVGSVMTPLRTVRLVKDSEGIGPLLMNELHASGFSRFPVVKSSDENTNPNIIGTLYIKDLVEHDSGGKVADLMNKKVYYVNETGYLRDALDAFLKTHHHLFIVVNNFEEVVGVLSIEDILEQILGNDIVDEFDKYDDLRAVAARQAKKEHTGHEATHPEPAEEPINPDQDEE